MGFDDFLSSVFSDKLVKLKTRCCGNLKRNYLQLPIETGKRKWYRLNIKYLRFNKCLYIFYGKF